MEGNELMKILTLFKFFPLQIFIFALILRLVPVIALRNMGIGLDDMFQYDMLARSISVGNGYRWYAEVDLPAVLPYLNLDLTSVNYDPRGVLTSFRPPLYPTFLALVYFVFGTGNDRFFVARIFQTSLGALLVPLTYAIAHRLIPGKEKVARISAIVVAFYPMLIIFPLSLATENLFFVLVLSSIFALLKAKESTERSVSTFGKIPPLIVRSRWYIISGILLGFTCLTRSVAQVFAIFAVLWIWLFLKEWKMALVSLLFTGIIIAPWVVRNSLIFGKITGIETALGYDLYLGYNPNGTGTFQYPQSLDLMTIVNDAQRDRIGIQDAYKFIISDPGRIIFLIFRRAGYFFGLERRALTYFYSNNFFGHISTPVLGGIFSIFCLPFIILCTSAVAGLPQLEPRRETWLLVLFFAGYIIPHLLIIAEDRFHLTLLPLLAILAAKSWTVGWQPICQQWKDSRAGKLGLIIVFSVILLLFANWGIELLRDSDKLALLFSANGNRTYFSY
jgi:hypothetical protein